MVTRRLRGRKESKRIETDKAMAKGWRQSLRRRESGPTLLLKFIEQEGRTPAAAEPMPTADFLRSATFSVLQVARSEIQMSKIALGIPDGIRNASASETGPTTDSLYTYTARIYNS